MKLTSKVTLVTRTLNARGSNTHVASPQSLRVLEPHCYGWSLIASAGSGSTHLLLAGGYCSSPSAVRLRPPQAVAISINAEMTSATRCKPLRPTPTA
ncbi:hypothetical protein GW17_00011576 [Ensete ventricosum]|nr:hypothetical protein GW17_00011576 [Ensete ventricosum]